MRAWVAMAYEDDEGRHQVGEEVDLPIETPEQKAGFERLVAFGILALEPPFQPEPAPIQPPTPPTPEPTSPAQAPPPAKKGRTRRQS